jgi:sulfate-transporting ATPase
VSSTHSWGTGFDSAVPFFVIVVYMTVRGQAIPLRDFFLQRLPAVGKGRLRPGRILVGVAAVSCVIALTSASWSTAITYQFVGGLVLLSIVLLTGYAGQLSLAQFAIAGVGALIAGRLVATQHWPFWASTLAAMAGAALLGFAFALPAIRTRGINLAIVTLGLGSAIQLVVFENGTYTGGAYGTDVGVPHLFGWNIDAITHPQRYAFICFGAFVVAAVAVANVRRGRTGRRLLAVRTNERAAAALGINVTGAKMYAFTFAGAIAALGGVLLAFQQEIIIYTNFTTNESLNYVGYAFAGGVGFLLGPVFGGTLLPGTIGTQVGDLLFSSVQSYLTLFGGAFVILVVIQNQDGMAHGITIQMNWIGKHLRKLLRLDPARLRRVKVPFVRPKRSVLERSVEAKRTKVEPKTLEADGITVRFGKVTAVNDVSMTINPGEIVGLIGPNGAGKTSFIEAVTGFTRPASGSVRLSGRSIDDLPVMARARAGLSRSFQSLELFEDLSVVDNLRAACDPRDILSYLRDPIYPVDPLLPGEVVAAIRDFRLEEHLEREVQDLPYGERRLVALARTVATTPSVILLDEPVSGLSETESKELIHVVRRLARDWGMGILVVEHDMGFVMNVCDRIVVLDFGSKIAEGTPEEVRNNPQVIAAYLGTESPTSANAAGVATVTADDETSIDP